MCFYHMKDGMDVCLNKPPWKLDVWTLENNAIKEPFSQKETFHNALSICFKRRGPPKIKHLRLEVFILLLLLPKQLFFHFLRNSHHHHAFQSNIYENCFKLFWVLGPHERTREGKWGWIDKLRNETAMSFCCLLPLLWFIKLVWIFFPAHCELLFDFDHQTCTLVHSLLPR